MTLEIKGLVDLNIETQNILKGVVETETRYTLQQKRYELRQDLLNLTQMLLHR